MSGYRRETEVEMKKEVIWLVRIRTDKDKSRRGKKLRCERRGKFFLVKWVAAMGNNQSNLPRRQTANDSQTNPSCPDRQTIQTPAGYKRASGSLSKLIYQDLYLSICLLYLFPSRRNSGRQGGVRIYR